MQLPQPYLYTSPRMVALRDRPQMAALEGIVADPVFGYHTLWAAEVPFIPGSVASGKGDSSKGKGEDGRKLEPVMQRQMRFLYDLAQSSEHLATFELRFVSQPQPHGPTCVGIVFLGKVFHTDAAFSRQLALGLWDKFSALFPREAPFSYPLVPIESYDAATTATHSFLDWFLPLPVEQLIYPQSIVELRKYEDWPSIRDIGRALHPRDYIPHPFVAALDHSAMARLFETMARQRQTVVVAITLRPQRLTDLEVALLHQFAGWYQRAPDAEPEVVSDNRLIQQWRELHSDSIDNYKRSRAELGQRVYDELVREHRSLFLIRLQVIGSPVAQDDVIEALGSEVMANVGNVYPSRWERVEAANPDELHWARFNMQWLEFARWGISPILQQDRRIIRLRQLATVAEAAGAFRLPIAPGRDTLAGMAVRDEPFTLPIAPLTEFDASCVLGTVLDRGVATTLHLSLPPDIRACQIQIFGERGVTREQLVERILAADAACPWILLREGGVSGRALAERLDARYISLERPDSQEPPGFHPLYPPPGVAPSVYSDALLRVLQTVCALEPATIPLLRQSLQALYQRVEQEAGFVPGFATLAEWLDAHASDKKLPSDIARALRTQCIPPLQDLALTTAHLRMEPAKSAFSIAPGVIDIGWLGGTINNALFYGCLWVWHALAFSQAPASGAAGAKGILALEDAHLLFPSRKQEAGTTPLASLMRSSTQAGIGTVLIDDRPDILDSTITNQAAVTILTRCPRSDVREYVAKLVGASSGQQARLALLQDLEAVIQLQGNVPVHIAL